MRESGGVEFEGKAKLSHRIPAGPEITAPEDGDVVPHDAAPRPDQMEESDWPYPPHSRTR